MLTFASSMEAAEERDAIGRVEEKLPKAAEESTKFMEYFDTIVAREALGNTLMVGESVLR